MSVWTHVAGIIRVDGLRIPDITNPKWDKTIGKELNYEDPSEVWADCEKHPEAFMPCGSEGSLKKVIWENPNTSSLASYTVSVFGDLRDYDDLAEIKNWFAKVCNKLWVRNAVITARCALGSSFTAHWDVEKEELVENDTDAFHTSKGDKYPDLEHLERIMLLNVLDRCPNAFKKGICPPQVELVAMFPQTWPDTAGGFSKPGTVAGQAFTTQITTVMEAQTLDTGEDLYGVFFDNAPAYLVYHASEAFFKDLNTHCLKSKYEAQKVY